MKIEDILIFYGVFGEGQLATWLRSTAVELSKLLIEFMICYWIWSFWPTWTMIFLIASAYVAWLMAWKIAFQIKYERAEAISRANALDEFERKWREE